MVDMNVEPSFLNNCNIMIFVLVAELLVGLALFFIGKLMVSKKPLYVGKLLLKQGFLTLIIFNSFNISFSAGVEWKYDS